MKAYDTSRSGNAANDSATWVGPLPLGRMVVIGSTQDASQNLTARAKRACESLGSSQIRQLGQGGSWAFVGKKGAASEAVAESLSNSSPAACSYWLFPRDRETGSGFNVSALSAGSRVGNYAQIASLGKVVNLPGGYGQGINVVVLDEVSGDVLEAHNYDTGNSGSTQASDAFAARIEGLSAGQLVVVAVKGDAAANLTDRAKRACGMIGSGLIHNLLPSGSWCAFGIKGTAPGSALSSPTVRRRRRARRFAPGPAFPGTA